MDSTEQRIVPCLTLFYQTGLKPILAVEEECSICYSKFEEDGDNVSVDPCKHIFHRECIVQWSKTQLLGQGGTRKWDCNYGVCPYDRIKLFHAIGMDAQEINAHSWVQSLHGLKGTQFETIGKQALDRIQSTTTISLELVKEVVKSMIQENGDYEPIAIEHGILPYRFPSHSQILLAVTQHGVDVDTEESYQFINEALRGDISSLRITATRYVSANIPDQGEGMDWIAAIEPIREAWQENGYPHTNYITIPSLHRLVICAMLVIEVVSAHGLDSTMSYARLLARGERLLLEAQERIVSGSLNETELREHYRTLDWTSTTSSNSGASYLVSRNVPVSYAHNAPRAQWIVRLRSLIRGPTADPLVS